MIELVGGKLYQWDTGREVSLSNAKSNAVQFANKGDSLAVTIKKTDGSCKIPDRYLMTGKPLVVWLVKINDEGDAVETYEAATFPVLAKPKPKNYVPTAAEAAYDIVKDLTDEAKAAAVVAEWHSNKAGEHAAAAAHNAVEATKQAGMSKFYAEQSEAAAEELAPLVVTTNGENSYIASHNAEDIWNAVSSKRDVILEIRGYGGPEDCSAPILAATEEQAVFAIIEAGNLILFIIDTDGEIIRRDYPLSRYAILDDKKTDSSATWSSAKILAMIAQGGTGDIDMGDDRAVKCGRVSAPELHVTDSIAEGFYVTSELVGGNYGKPVAVFNGTNGDEAVVLRHIAPGTQGSDAVNKAQLDAVEATANSKAKIDNTAVGADAWSSQNTVDKLCPKVNESSPCVQMQPVSGSRVKVSVKKDSEYSHIKLYCTGKNLYPNNFSSLDEGQNFFVEGYIHKGNGKLTDTGTSIASGYIPVSHLVGKTLAIAGAYVGGSNPGFAFYDAYKTFLGTQYSGNTATALVPKDAAYFRFTIKYDNIRGADGKVDYGRIQLEIGNAVTEVEPYREISIDPASGDIELNRVFLDGVNTFYAYAGTMDGKTFIPGKAVDVHVEGYNHPVYEIEKQRKEIEQLRNAIVSLGSNI